MTTMPVPDQPFLVIEFPHAMSERTLAEVRHGLADAAARGQPIVLSDGARIKHIGPDGTVTPATYYVNAPDRWGWQVIVGALIGEVLTLTALLLTGNLS